ncbi:MAG TPA: hypothetical protein VM689_16685 [Aliidongia sp.]|nr:hypothetical protein [Aliidongia sp.]
MDGFMRPVRAGLTLLAAATLVACASRYEPPPPAPPLAGALPPSAPTSPPLSAAQDQALVSGSTISGIGETGEPYFAFFDPSGTVHFRQGSFEDNGTWHARDDGRLCTLYRKVGNGAEHCYAFYQIGPQIVFYEPNGQSSGAFTILHGNPQDL